MDFSKLLLGFVNIGTWISLNFYLGLSILVYRFVYQRLKVVLWICQNWCLDFSKLLQCYMDLPKPLYGFVKFATWTCESCSMYFSPKQNQVLELLEDSALNQSCWMSQSTQCLGSVVPLATFCFYISVLINIRVMIRVCPLLLPTPCQACWRNKTMKNN